jgi:hypothetical protein
VTLFVIAFSLGMLVLGYLVMRGIDGFLERGGIIDSPQGRAHRGALVYGPPGVIPQIERAGLPCKLLAEPSFPDEYRYAALFILSENDGANLALLLAAKRADPDIFVVARANARALYAAYGNAGANRVICEGESLESLLAELSGD